MNYPKLITWSCPEAGCRKTHFTPVPANGVASLLCNLCGYTARVEFAVGAAAEPVPTDPNDPKFQPF
jgi:rubredoxin